MYKVQRVTSFIFPIILVLFVQALSAQSVTYRNSLNAYYNKANTDINAFFERKINEITLNVDSTFDCWSRPNSSCGTWGEYKGTWKKERDTIVFYDNYEVVEIDVRATYKKDDKQVYHISFSTDKNSKLKNKALEIQYEYDFDAHLQDTGRIVYIKPDNVVEIPFRDIPNHNKLAAIRIEYQLNYKEKRYIYLTENRIINIRKGDVPNVISVMFVENPKRETVYRKIKAVIKNDVMVIVSATKSKTTLPDYHEDILFEDSYALDK